MRKKFTMLLASLFMTMGTVWAQLPEVGKVYRIKDDKTEKYLTIRSYNGNSGTGTHGTVPLLEKSEGDTDQMWTLEAAGTGTFYLKSKSGYYLKCRGWNVDALNGGDKSAVSLETPSVEYLTSLTLPAYKEGTSFCIKNGDKYFKSQAVGQDGGTVHPFCNAQKSDGWSDRTTWTFEEVPTDEFFDADKLYRVYNKKKDNNGNYADAEDMAWSPEGNHLAVYNAEAENQLWRFIQGTGDNAEKYLIYNVATGQYMRAVGGGNGVQLTANENEAVYYTMQKHASENMYAFYRDNGSDPRWWLFNDGGGKLAGWTGNDNEYFFLEAVEGAVDVTYSFKFDGVEKYAQTESLIAGDKYPDFDITFPFGVTAEAKPAGRVGLTDVTEEIELTVALPFQYAASYNDIEHWYYLTIRDSEPTFMYYDPDLECIRATGADVPGDNKNAYSWSFVGNPFDGFSIVNRAAGETMVLSAPVAPTGNANAAELARMVVADGATGNLVWDFMTPTHYDRTPKPVAGTFYVQHPTAKSYAFNRQDINKIKTVCYWNQRDTGSALHVIECDGVHDLSALSNATVYTLQAQRSPLMYSTTEGKTSKLSSGLVDRVAAVKDDVNQQFLIMRTNDTPADKYYLYSVGAGKFVNENLEFTDFPTPVLSFEPYNNTVFPWWVKIGDKYVIPGDGGTAGNCIFHTEGGEDDGGKRFRIGVVGNDLALSQEVGLIVERAEGLIKEASQLNNAKVYTVSTHENGYWYFDNSKEALWSTKKAGVTENPDESTHHFAFLTVAEKTYIYSVAAQKFVVKHEGHTAYSDDPTYSVELLKAEGDQFYPVVVAYVNGENRHHIGISNGYEIPVITSWNDLNDGGNKVEIREVAANKMAEGTAELLAAAVTKIENYLVLQELKPEVEALIAQAQALLEKENYLVAEDKESLSTAKTTAQGVLDAGTFTADDLNAQVAALTEAIAQAINVRIVGDFKNAYVYTLASPRGWLGAAEDNDKVISANNGAADDDNYHWAVYKSAGGNYYLYNIGKGMFMGTVNDGEIPFAAKPQSTTLTIKNTDVSAYPIMFSPNNGSGSVNHGKSDDEVINATVWNGGWESTDDEGNTHKVTVAAQIDAVVLTEIENIVAVFEAIQNLDVAIAAVQAKEDKMDELGYYSSSNVNYVTEFDAIKDFKEAITDETTLNAINEQIAAANNLIASFTVLNVPQAGKFYRFKHPSKDAYMLSNKHTDNKHLAMGTLENNPISSIFYYDSEENSLLSYAIGQYLSEADDAINNKDWTCKTVGSEAPEVTFGAGYALGTIGFYLGNNESRAYYSARETYVDAGGKMANANGGYDWTVEEVTTLPVAVSAAGYATLYAPVALTIPAEGVTVYTATVDGNTLKLNALTTGTIPAETGVIIEAAQGTYNFAVVADVDPISGNALTGKYAKSVKNPDTNVNVYTLQMPNKEDKNSVGFYLFNGTDGTKTTYINGFRAWVELAAGSNVQALRFTRGDDATGIESVEASEELVIFDLAGRRVEKMEKGIYIVNGKKVIK